MLANYTWWRQQQNVDEQRGFEFVQVQLGILFHWLHEDVKGELFPAFAKMEF